MRSYLEPMDADVLDRAATFLDRPSARLQSSRLAAFAA
jgi:hypothetical protein